MSDNVPVPTVELLIKELKDVVDDWKVFGVSLGVPVRKLNAIELADPRGGVENWKLKMFQFWLQYKPDDPSWKDVVRALEENNYIHLATTLSRKYLLPADSNEDEDKSINEDEIKAEIRATAAVVEKLRDLESSFTDMLTDLLDLFTECKCDLSRARFFLDDRLDTEKFSQCTSFDSLLRQLRKGHIDAFNTYYLKRLVTRFKKDELTERIKEYEAEKEIFLKDTTVLEFQRAVVSKVEPLPSGQMIKLTIKISKRLADKRSLKDMEELALRSFGECQDFICIHAEPGSVIISWFFPEALSDKLEHLARKNAAVFKDAGVEEVTVGGRVVFPCTLEEDIPAASLKEIYTDSYHRLVEAVSDERTCQSLLTQLSSPALISKEKIAQLTSSKVTGSSFLKTLGLEEEPHLLVPLVSAMSGVEQLQTLAENMNSTLRSKKGHMIAFVRMMREKGSLNLRTLHLILHGLPAAGKTCAKLRLTGQELTSRKPAERRDGTLVYPLDDGARSTPVAEKIVRARLPAQARLPASATALTREADDLPWYLLQSLDEEMVGLVETIAKLSSETKNVKKPITATASSDSVPSSSQAISLPAKPVGKAFQEMITSAFSKAPRNTLQDILKETLIYLIDSGGQPQFQELLPILVSGPSVFLLTFSLAVPLDAVYQVHFTDKDGKREDYPTNMRVKDVLTQSLASIRCTCSYQTNGEERVEVKPRVIFMATMRSLVSDEEIAAVDKQLKSLVEPFSDLIVYNESGVLFPVDSFTGEGIPALRTAVRRTADDVITKVTGGIPYTSPMCEVKLPTTAVALELLLRKQEKGIISLDQCKRLAMDCNIDPETELPNILWLLHHVNGSIRYYPEDTTLRQCVVTRPQRLYNIPSTLLTHTFAFKKGGEPFYSPKVKVWTRGLFTMETLRKLWGQDQDLTPDLIVSFLIHLNIIVQMHDEESGEELFFMPSALVCAPDDYFIDAKVSVDSILICFYGGYSPKGVFSSVIAYLPKEREEENDPVDLKWCLPSTVGSLCCNQATLVVSVNEEFDLLVRFTVHLKFIEISVNSECDEDPVSPAQLQLGCEAVLHDVSRAVQVVSQRLHYNSNATLKDGLFFPCYCSNDPSTHAVKYLPMRKKGKCHCRSSHPDQLWMHKWIKGTIAQ